MTKIYWAIIYFMCKVLHEEVYQAQMDFAVIIILGILVVLGWPTITAHVSTFHHHADEDEEE